MLTFRCVLLDFHNTGVPRPSPGDEKSFFQALNNHEKMRCEKGRARDTSRDTHRRLKGSKGGPKGGTITIDWRPNVVILEPSPRLRIEDP